MAESQQIQIKASGESLKGHYTNLMQVAHTKEEVVLDFLLVTMNPPQGQHVSRIIASPGHAKRMLAALTDNLKKYEAQFGPIAEASSPSEQFGF